MRTRPRLWNQTDPDRPRRCQSIMRPAPLGNPFKIPKHGNRTTVLHLFEMYARSLPEILKLIRELDDVDLVCCCAPMPCHGDVILRLWDEQNAHD